VCQALNPHSDLKKAAVLVPYDRYAAKEKRKLGPLVDRGKYVIHEDFKLSEPAREAMKDAQNELAVSVWYPFGRSP